MLVISSPISLIVYRLTTAHISIDIKKYLIPEKYALSTKNESKIHIYISKPIKLYLSVAIITWTKKRRIKLRLFLSRTSDFKFCLVYKYGRGENRTLTPL